MNNYNPLDFKPKDGKVQPHFTLSLGGLVTAKPVGTIHTF